MRKIFFLMSLILSLLPLHGFCSVQNICNVIEKHPGWYHAAKVSQRKWGVPVAVQMAIIHQESHFKADAKNPTSTAFGYAQAVNEIWHTYKEHVSQVSDTKQKRNVFADATNFIGWYAHSMKKQIHISPKNAFDLYLAYHDGGGGYVTDLHKPHVPTRLLADEVQSVASEYRSQLASC